MHNLRNLVLVPAAAAVALGLVAALLMPIGASAQSVNCTTYFADTAMPQTSCSGPSGSIDCTTYFANTPMPQTNCTGSGFAPPPLLLPPPPIYVAPPPPTVVYVPQPVAPPPPPPPTPGAYGTQQGRSVYFPQGALLRDPSQPTIYEVWSGRRFTIQTWLQYLNLGGKADLSNTYSVTKADLDGIPFGGVVPS